MSGPLPLAGLTVLVTRPRTDRDPLAGMLSGFGALVIEEPAVEIVFPDDTREIDAALGALEENDWIAFTSANAVRAVAARLQAGVVLHEAVAIAAAGPQTAAVVASEMAGRVVALQPAQGQGGEALAEAFLNENVQGATVLLPVSDLAGDLLHQALIAQGARPVRQLAYRTRAPQGLGGRLASFLSHVQLVTFASPSAVQAFAAAAGDRGLAIPAIAIGATTAAAVKAAGMRLSGTALTAGAGGMVEAVLACIQAGKKP